MVITSSTELPSEQELQCEEVPLGTPYLKASAFHLGKRCEPQNNEFMLCRWETDDPRKCVKDGKAVTECSMNFFRDVKANCAAEFTQYAMCLERSSPRMFFDKCRATQFKFDQCMKDKLDMERPFYGYHMMAKVHKTDRAKPEEQKPAYMDDPRAKKLIEFPDELTDKEKKTWGPSSGFFF